MVDPLRFLRPNKSTNVRVIERGPLAVARAVLPWLSAHAPAVAGLAADWMFFSPWRRSRGAGWPEGGRRVTVAVDGVTVRGRRWGAGPLVFLVHGWEGTGAQMGGFVEPLVARGFRVVAWDAPGHGGSGGWRSSMVTFARAIEEMAALLGTPHAIVAHSLGGGAAVLAARRGLGVARLCLVGAPAHPLDWVERFAATFGLGEEAVARMRRRAEARLGVPFEDIDVPRLARGLVQPVLVVHDAGDREVPAADADEIAKALGDVQVVRTSGLGHQRILRDPGVVETVAAFLGRPRAAWSAEALEEELFDRDQRGEVA